MECVRDVMGFFKKVMGRIGTQGKNSHLYRKRKEEKRKLLRRKNNERSFVIKVSILNTMKLMIYFDKFDKVIRFAKW